MVICICLIFSPLHLCGIYTYLHYNSERQNDLGIHHISIWTGKHEISISTKGSKSFTLETGIDNTRL